MGARLPNFEWTRFWVARDGHLVLDDEGFLADPEGKSGRFQNPYAEPFEAALSHRCAVLLGEPGIGKPPSSSGSTAKGFQPPLERQSSSST